MASDQFGRAFIAGIGIIGLTAVLVAATFIKEADADTPGKAVQSPALLVISSNTHLVLRDRQLNTTGISDNAMVCNSVVTMPFVAIGLNCDRI